MNKEREKKKQKIKGRRISSKRKKEKTLHSMEDRKKEIDGKHEKRRKGEKRKRHYE